MLRYYIEISVERRGFVSGNRRIAGEYKTDKRLSERELYIMIQEFAIEEGICASWAVENCRYKVENYMEGK